VPWTTEDRFDIEARAQGNPKKADYRLMMQSLLADRFQLKVHYETRVVPLYVLVLAKPGKFGPRLRLHQADDPYAPNLRPRKTRMRQTRKDIQRSAGGLMA
jgi:uncharacterized protein (TIGR03435 family)